MEITLLAIIAASVGFAVGILYMEHDDNKREYHRNPPGFGWAVAIAMACTLMLVAGWSIDNSPTTVEYCETEVC